MDDHAAWSHSAYARFPVHSRRAIVNALLSVVLLTALMLWGRMSVGQSTGGEPQPPNKQTKDSSPPSSLKVSPEEQYLLMKLQIERELQDEILKWAQTRFWILAGVSALVGFFGIRSFMRELVAAELKDAMRASAEANAAAAQGKDAVKEVRAEAARYSTTVAELTAAARTVNQKFGELASRIDAEGTRSVAAADLKISAIDVRLSELRGMVEVLAKDSEGTRKALAEFEARRRQAEQSVASTQAEFHENSTFRVGVVSHGPGSPTEKPALEVVDALSKLGFKAFSGYYAGEGTAIGRDIRIQYDAAGEKKAELVRSVVAKVTAGNASWEGPIKLSQRGAGRSDFSEIDVLF